MHSRWTKDDALIWLSGGTLVVGFLMIAGLMLMIAVHGLGFFWPQDLVRYALRDGRVFLGQEISREIVRSTDQAGVRTTAYRIQVRPGNRELYPDEFVWFEEDQVIERDVPREAVVVERVQGGDFYGFLESFVDDGRAVATGHEAVWEVYQSGSRNWSVCAGRGRCPSNCLRRTDDCTRCICLTSCVYTFPMQ